MWQWHDVLATAVGLAARWRGARLHHVLLQRLADAGKIDWSRASLDSASVPAKRGAERQPALIRLTAASLAPSVILSLTAAVSRSPSSSRQPTSMIRSGWRRPLMPSSRSASHRRAVGDLVAAPSNSMLTRATRDTKSRGLSSAGDCATHRPTWRGVERAAGPPSLGCGENPVTVPTIRP